MAGTLQRSSVSFRRQGSSGRVWDNRHADRKSNSPLSVSGPLLGMGTTGNGLAMGTTGSGPLLGMGATGNGLAMGTTGSGPLLGMGTTGNGMAMGATGSGPLTSISNIPDLHQRSIQKSREHNEFPVYRNISRDSRSCSSRPLQDSKPQSKDPRCSVLSFFRLCVGSPKS